MGGAAGRRRRGGHFKAAAFAAWALLAPAITPAAAQSVAVSGTISATFVDGIAPCSGVFDTSLNESLVEGLNAVSGVEVSTSDVSDISIDICLRRLAEGAEERRLSVPGVISYAVTVEGASRAQAVVRGVAKSTSAFVAAFTSHMTTLGETLSDVVPSLLAASESTSTFQSVAVSAFGVVTDALTGIQAPRWRVVGRDVSSEWVVAFVGFYSDGACSDLIEVRPQRGRGGRVNGRAFAAPQKRAPQGVEGDAADAFEDNSVSWRSTKPCSALADECYIGFDWLSGQVGRSQPLTYGAPGVVQRSSIAPQCVRLEQSQATGEYAHTVHVQYRLDGGSWTSHTVAPGLLGGRSYIRLPLVA